MLIKSDIDNINLMEGEQFSHDQVLDLIFLKLRKAVKDPTGEYESLRDMFESAFGYTFNIEYLPSTERFVIFEDIE